MEEFKSESQFHDKEIKTCRFCGGETRKLFLPISDGTSKREYTCNKCGKIQ